MGGNALWLPPQHLDTCVVMHSGVHSQPRMAALGAGHGMRNIGCCNILFLDANSRSVTLCSRLHTRKKFLSRTICGKGYGKALMAFEDYCGFLHETLAVGVLGFRKSGRILITKASSDGSEKTPGIPSISVKLRNRLERALDVPRTVWAKLVHPLSNFGFGRRSVWEAGVGLFVLSGFILLFMALAWVKGLKLRTSRKYLATFEFSKAWGITNGTAVRIRGVDVGSVAAVRPSLERLDVVVQIADARVVIPRNALVEVNQSGLVSETLIDITPRFPLPQPTVGPLDPNCQAEGLIVCHRDRIKGEQGVSLDELVKICTKLARQIDEQGLQKLFEASERISLAVEEAKPLLAKAESMAGDIAPLLKEIQDGGFLQDLDRLIKVATAAGEDLRKLNTAILTPENTELLRQSVSTLTKTLKHVENISGDLGILTGDAGMQYNLKQLIQSLSRLVAD